MKNMPISKTLGAHPHAADTPLPHVDDVPNRAVAEYQRTLTDWRAGEHDLADLVLKLRPWASSLLDRFVIEPVPRPEFLFRFRREEPIVLGHYVPHRNDIGLRWEISFNPLHVGRRSERQIAAVLMHELLHWLEGTIKPTQLNPNGYHSAWFRKRAQAIGIPCTKYGAELGILVPSPFTTWADERGLTGTPGAFRLPPTTSGTTPSPSRRRSKRDAWTCACPTDARITVQVPRGSELLARCERCYELFKRKGSR